MKIVFCIGQLYSSGGGQRVLIERLNYLADNTKYEIIVVTTHQKNKKNFYLLNKKIKIIDLNIPYDNLVNQNFMLRKFNRYLYQHKHLKKMIEVIKSFSPDIIVAHGTEEKWIIPKIKFSGKILLERHLDKYFLLKNPDKNILKNILKKRIIFREQKLINKYDRFIVLTESNKKQWLVNEKLNKRITVIENPLPFYPSKISNCKNKTIISIGRLEYQKGYDELIEIWSKIFKKYPDWKLEIYGEGNIKKELQEKINKLGVADSLFLKGTDQNIIEKYLESSIYIMSSRYEGMPMVLLEAMACGLPVVSFDCPCGPKDIIKDGEDGFLIRNRNLDEMANKLEFLMQNETQRKIMGKKAHENIARYSKDKIMLQWKNLFEELVNNEEN